MLTAGPALGRCRGGDPGEVNLELLKRLLRLLARQHDRFVPQYTATLASNDSGNALALLHSLRGAAAILSFAPVMDSALAIESGLRAGQELQGLDHHSQQMLQAMNLLRPVLDEV